MNAYEKNTGTPHPLSAIKTSTKHATGGDPLTNSGEQLWYGSISIGTPRRAFTGVISLCHSKLSV